MPQSSVAVPLQELFAHHLPHLPHLVHLRAQPLSLRPLVLLAGHPRDRPARTQLQALKPLSLPNIFLSFLSFFYFFYLFLLSIFFFPNPSYFSFFSRFFTLSINFLLLFFSPLIYFLPPVSVFLFIYSFFLITTTSLFLSNFTVIYLVYLVEAYDNNNNYNEQKLTLPLPAPIIENKSINLIYSFQTPFTPLQMSVKLFYFFD